MPKFRVSELEKDLPLPAFTGVEIPNGYDICHYCVQEGKVGKATLTPNITKTVGEMKPRKSISTYIDHSFDPAKFVGDHVVHYSSEMVACPEHALMLTREPLFVRLKWPKRGEGV